MVNLLLVIGVILAILWLLGLITSYTYGGAVHILLIIAVIAIVIWAFKRKK
ncbi:MAG: lmo0937 family membrane protein [Spirochaetes bacterium]|nr:lmo0937 family membrane protein [Spirochaetota bacterium]